ncbi:MAG: hypothetical protein AAFV31_13035 [Pseudomonadota bacterium]
MSFFIAMLNRRATASYWYPQTIISERNEFLIVSRSGGGNEFLSISSAGACTGLEDVAPSRLSPDLVVCATFVSQGPNGAEVFIVEHDPPDGCDVKGNFVGGDGYVLLEQSSQELRLRGSARFKPGAQSRAVSRHCLLLGENEPGAAVHFRASYIPWDAELLPADFDAGPRTGLDTEP